MTSDAHSSTTTDDAITATSVLRVITNDQLNQMELKINRLLEPTATDEDVLSALDTEAALVAITKQYRAKLKDALIRYIDERGDVETVTGRLYVGNTKTTKCNDVSRTIDAILRAADGDFEAFVSCLNSQPLKHGACHEVLGDKWGQHFTETIKKDIKTGAPTRSIKRALLGKEG